MPQCRNKLSTLDACLKLQSVDLSVLPPATNKGERGQLIEKLIGLTNNSDLTDLTDGEIKTYTIGETIAVTQLGHCLSQIIDTPIPFDESMCATKLSQVIYIGFDKGSGQCKGFKLINRMLEPEHYLMLQQDYSYIADAIRKAFDAGEELTTISGENNMLQIRTKASKRSDGTYSPLVHDGVTLKNKGMAFYLKADFGRSLFN